MNSVNNNSISQVTAFYDKDMQEIGSTNDYVNRLPATMATTIAGADKRRAEEYIYSLAHEGLGLSFLEFAHRNLSNLADKAPQMEKEDLLVKLRDYTKRIGQGIQRSKNNFRTYMTNVLNQIAIRPCDEAPTTNAT